jgi:hypothetical protein
MPPFVTSVLRDRKQFLSIFDLNSLRLTLRLAEIGATHENRPVLATQFADAARVVTAAILIEERCIAPRSNNSSLSWLGGAHEHP